MIKLYKVEKWLAVAELELLSIRLKALHYTILPPGQVEKGEDFIQHMIVVSGGYSEYI